MSLTFHYFNRNKKPMIKPIFRSAPLTKGVPHPKGSSFLHQPPQRVHWLICYFCCSQETMIHDYEPNKNVIQKPFKISMKVFRRNRSGSQPTKPSTSQNKSKKTATTSKISMKKMSKKTRQFQVSPSSPFLPQSTNFNQKGTVFINSQPQQYQVASAPILHEQNRVKQTEGKEPAKSLSHISPSNISIEDELNSILEDKNERGSSNQHKLPTFRVEDNSSLKLIENNQYKSTPNIVNEYSSLQNFSFGHRQKQALLQKFKSVPNIPMIESKNQVIAQSKESKRISFSSYQLDSSIQHDIQRVIIESKDGQGEVKYKSLSHITERSRIIFHSEGEEESHESMVLYTHSSFIEKDKSIAELLA